MEIEKIIRDEDFYRLGEQWDNLLHESKSGNIFLTWEWLSTWWNTFKTRDCRLYLLIAKEANSLVGIAPLYQRRGLLFKQLRFLGDGIVCSDYLEFIILPQFKDCVFKGFLDYLSKNNKDWEFLFFEGILMEKKEESALDDWCAGHKYTVGAKKKVPCPYIRLPDNNETLLNNLTGDSLKKYLYERRRLEKLGNLELMVYFDKSQEKEIQDKFDEFVELHKKRWHERGYLRKSPFWNRRFLGFHKKVILALLDKGWVNILCLNVQGKTIAAHYNLFFNNRFFHYLPTFDIEWAKYSPGEVALFEAIKYAISKRIKIFDFLRGDEPYKMKLSRSIYMEFNIVVIRKSITGTIYIFISRLLNYLKGY